MAKNYSNFRALFKQLASSDIQNCIKSFISGLLGGLKNLPTESLKPEHRQEFITLRSQCRELINQTRNFCDKAIPCLEYALAQYNSPNPVNIKELAEKLLAKVDPRNILEQCEQLENKILTLNDQIATDEYYKGSKIMLFLSIGSSTTLAIASLVGIFFLPLICEFAAIVTATTFITKIVGPVTQLLFEGVSKMETLNDSKQCRQKIIDASSLMYAIKMELSDVTQSHASLEIQLDFEDVHDLQTIYRNLLKNMQEIRVICSKPFPT